MFLIEVDDESEGTALELFKEMSDIKAIGLRIFESTIVTNDKAVHRFTTSSAEAHRALGALGRRGQELLCLLLDEKFEYSEEKQALVRAKGDDKVTGLYVTLSNKDAD